MAKSKGLTNFTAVFRKYFSKKDALLIPNILCYIRLILVVAFFVTYLIDFSIAGNEMAHYYVSFAFMIVAAYTDFLDGFIARKFSQTSNLGKILDPLSDIFLQGMASIALCTSLYDYAAVWALLIVLLVKEVCQALYLIFLASHGKSLGQAHWFGKVASFITYLLLAFLLVGTPFLLQLGEDYAETVRLTINICCYIGIAVLAFAWGCYTLMTIHIYKEGSTEVPLDENGLVIENNPEEEKKPEETTSVEEEHIDESPRQNEGDGQENT